MSTHDSIRTIRDLIHSSAAAHGEKDFLRYIEEGEIKSVTFTQFRIATDAIAAWTTNQNKKLGRSAKIAMLSPNSAIYFQKLMSDIKLERSILNRKGNGDLTCEKNAAIHDFLGELNINKINEFCNKNGISKNVLFLTAFNICVGLFADMDDVISTSIHNGRTDSRWGSIAGALFTTYNFRYTLNKNQSILDMLNASAKQVMETMCSHVNNLHADEMFIQYQGDLFSDLEIGGKAAEYIPLQLDSLPFHLMIHESKNGFNYELRYWENRFEEKQLRIFMDIFESVLKGITEVNFANEISGYIPEKYLVNEWKAKIEDEEHIVTIKNRYGDVQPIGAWGTLYIDGENQGRTARMNTDNTVDFLENSGRCIMQETLTGRYFVDLEKLEKEFCAYSGVISAKAYICYGENNKLVLTAELTAEKDTEICALKEYAKEKFAVSSQPHSLFVNGEKVI